MSDDDYELVYFSLQRRVTRGSAFADVCIYRGSDQKEWTLEIQHQTGGSTVWDELFKTEQEALDEALSSIDAEGVDAFIVREPHLKLVE